MQKMKTQLINDNDKQLSSLTSEINSNQSEEIDNTNKDNFNTQLLNRKFVPKPKPKTTYINPSPMILCSNVIALEEDNKNLNFKLEKQKNQIDSEEEGEELDNEMLSALPQWSLKEKRENKIICSIYEGKMSKDAEEILSRKSSKLISDSMDKQQIKTENSSITRHTINVLANTDKTVYSILKYMEITIQDKEARCLRSREGAIQKKKRIIDQ